MKRLKPTDIAILAGLTLAALLPRIILALQLDMVTDEPFYIGAGKIDLPLLEHFQIGASEQLVAGGSIQATILETKRSTSIWSRRDGNR